MRPGGRRRATAVLAAVAILAMGVLAAAPAEAGRDDRAPIQRARFQLTGALCPADGPATAGWGRGARPRRLTGSTDASIDLLTGQLTVELRWRRGHGGVRASGRWALDPDASTGTISGRVRVSGDGDVRWWGRGEGALADTRVTARGTFAASDGSCAGGVRFDSEGRAARPDPAAPIGAVQVAGTKPFADAVADLTTAIETNPNLTLLRTVDHRAAAASRGLVLGPTTELFFGNPNIGTPLMQSAQTTGIDLPQKLLVWEDLLGTVRVAYNAPAYLRSRHGITGADGQLTAVGNALAALAGVATGTEVDPVFDAGTVPLGAGLVTIESGRPPDEAFAAIVEALEAAPPVNVAIVLEHDANAARVGLELDPTKLVVFGNPSLGTGLMQTDRSVALDLPQKILVYRTGDGPTLISWNDPAAVAKRHGLTGQQDLLDTLAGALANFASQGQ